MFGGHQRRQRERQEFVINQTLLPALLNHLHDDIRIPLPHKNITGLQHIDKCIAIDQSPIGRTPAPTQPHTRG